MAAVERAHPEHPDYQVDTKPYLRFMNRYQQCLPHVKGQVVLDVPCGVGWGSSTLKGAKRVYGLDIDEPSIEYARMHYKGIKFDVGSMCAMPYKTVRFGVVILMEGYEHLAKEDQPTAISEVVRVLGEGGKLIFLTPLNGHSKDNPFHLYEPTEEEVKAVLLPHFEPIEMEVIGDKFWFIGTKK